MEKLLQIIQVFMSTTMVCLFGIFICLGIYLLNPPKPEEPMVGSCGNVNFESRILIDPSIKINKRGKRLFEEYCQTCHSITDEIVVGPGLENVTKRRNTKWLRRFIRNSSKMIKSGDPYARKLFKMYNYTVMTSFESFSNADIDSILEYTKSFESGAIP